MFESFANWIVTLPDPIPAAIALGVLYLVTLVLKGRVPDAFRVELAGLITTFLVTVINLALGLIPLQWEAIAQGILNLIAVLVGMVIAVRAYLLVKVAAAKQGIL